MTGTGIIHSNNLQICLGGFRGRRAAAANALRAGTHPPGTHRWHPPPGTHRPGTRAAPPRLRARPAPPGMGPRSRAGCALPPPHFPAPGRSPPSPSPSPRPPVICFSNVSLQRGPWAGGGKDGYPGTGCGDGEGPREGLAAGRRGGQQRRGVWGELLLEGPGRGVGAAHRGCFGGQTRGCRCRRAVCPYTRVRGGKAFQSRLRSLPPLGFNFLCVPPR